MSNIHLIILLVILLFLIFSFEKKIKENMTNTKLDEVFINKNDSFYAKNNNYVGDFIIRCNESKTNICDHLKKSNDKYNVEILDVHTDNYPLSVSKDINENDEILLKPYDFTFLFE